MTFQEFLEKKATQRESKDRRELRDEWVASVTRLLETIRRWLGESDPKKVLEVSTTNVLRHEPYLGTYEIPSLKISLGDQSIGLLPNGRLAVGVVGTHGNLGLRAEGRIDIGDGIRKCILYRTVSQGEETWYALDENFQAKPLDKARLEEILQDFLS